MDFLEYLIYYQEEYSHYDILIDFNYYSYYSIFSHLINSLIFLQDETVLFAIWLSKAPFTVD